MTDLAKISELLQRSMGLDATAIGISAIERAVQERCVACKLKDRPTYWEHVSTSEAELQDLIESVVVPETWFFRDREAFATLARMAQEVWPRAHPDGVLHLLSLPCSTGEEPYSMAMALLDAGIPPGRFQIDAVDISERALLAASRGLYGRNSFRGGEQTFRDRYFVATPGGAQLNDAVRRQVRTQQGNLLAPGFQPCAATYDVIFCRNLLIYFDRETQDRAVLLLRRLLAPDGTLFVGPSETSLIMSHDFVSARAPLSFAFRKSAAVPKPSAAAPIRKIIPRPISRPLTGPVKAPRPKAAASPSAPGIDEAARLADQGQLTAAATICEDHLRRHGASPQAFYLMGLIQDAGGNMPGAERHYRKALYLDQSHHEALTHLALLLERQGDVAAARLLRGRAARVSAR